MFIVVVSSRNADGWSYVVGPFNDEDTAMRWTEEQQRNGFNRLQYTITELVAP